MSSGSNPQAYTDTVIAGYEVQGFDAGERAPAEVGQTIKLQMQGVVPGQEMQPFGMVLDGDTAVALAKSILATATTLGIDIGDDQ